MLAAFYCQELIRNTHILCQSYIQKLQGAAAAAAHQTVNVNFGNSSDAGQMDSIPGTVPYYVEENEKLLNLLITNCEPILREMQIRFDQFNTINSIHDGFAELHQTNCESDGGPELLGELQNLFSIRSDVQIYIEAGTIKK